MLLEYHCRTNRSFQAVRLIPFYNFAKGSDRATVLLPVVRERTEVALYSKRCVEPLDEFPLGSREAFGVGNHA